jgi:hypothetical protein
MRHDEIESPSWHEPVLDKRRTQIENGEAKFISIDDLKGDAARRRVEETGNPG